MRVSTRTSRAYRAPALYGEPRFALPPHTPNCVGYGDFLLPAGASPHTPVRTLKIISDNGPIFIFFILN